MNDQASMMAALQNFMAQQKGGGLQAPQAAPSQAAAQAAMAAALKNQAAPPQAVPSQIPPGVAALLAARPSLGFKKGGKIASEKKMIGKEIAFMKQKGAPKSMNKHEKAEAKSMGVKAYAKGGSVRGGGCETKGKTKGRMC
jgi:hypothetical protein